MIRHMTNQIKAPIILVCVLFKERKDTSPLSCHQMDQYAADGEHQPRVMIWAKGSSSMRWAPDRTATFPLPPMLVLHIPHTALSRG